jgi:hypothetical protein
MYTGLNVKHREMDGPTDKTYTMTLSLFKILHRPLKKLHTQTRTEYYIYGHRENTFFTAVLKPKGPIHSQHSYFQYDAYRCHEWGSAHMTFTTLLLS